MGKPHARKFAAVTMVFGYTIGCGIPDSTNGSYEFECKKLLPQSSICIDDSGNPAAVCMPTACGSLQFILTYANGAKVIYCGLHPEYQERSSCE